MSALALAEAGHDIILNYMHSEGEATELQRRIASIGVRCLLVQADISKTEDVKRLVHTMNERIGMADIVVNNAGPFVRERRLFADYTEEEILFLLNGNLTGVMLLDHMLLPSMRRRGWGESSIMDSAMREKRVRGRTVRYTPQPKVGLVSFTKTLAVEEARMALRST